VGEASRGALALKYRIEFKRSVAKVLKKLPKPDRRRIRNKIDSLTENLPDPAITKRKGDNPFHRVRVGDYRIIYEVREDTLLILVLKIGHRKEVYRGLT
jgi:mRNA interferase RelE/StbE